MARITGTVKWFNDAKGFGFITPENGEKDCVVHHTALLAHGFKSVAEGERVEFDVVQRQTLPTARDEPQLKPTRAPRTRTAAILSRRPVPFVPPPPAYH